MLVISAEQNFKTSNPKKGQTKQKKSPFFSKEHKNAYAEHVQICKEWRLAGRPVEKSHPAKNAKLLSQRNLQQIARECESSTAIKNDNDLMMTYYADMGKVCAKLKQIRGAHKKSINISEIETVCGVYEGRNVLEGFRANTEIVCNEKSSESSEIQGDQSEFYKMCISDNFIISQQYLTVNLYTSKALFSFNILNNISFNSERSMWYVHIFSRGHLKYYKI